MKKLITLLIFSTNIIGFSQELTIVEQNYNEAKKLAKKENKLLFIDFYTTWCKPCKKMDKWIFQDKNKSKKLAKDFVLLRYDAEKDKEFHLSKKHHVNSYPTGIILNRKGFVVNRKYGFASENIDELSKAVYEFTDQSIELDKQKKILKGYSNTIKISNYPKFYIDFVNRDNTKVTRSEDFKNYWKTNTDLTSEEYFSTLVYFAKDVPINIANDFLERKEKYTELYGETDVNVALVFFSFGKFEDAIEHKNEEKFDKAVEFVNKALSKESAERMTSLFQKQFDEAKKG
ncbi:thioredoxin family protein [Winogradskyella immobilis]|uniref:Thioredoxin family protein n=1 Tax=Winogradskyella immobilis TaxID=2816852 RepID=A0ABS8EQS4_9FLAO|nr:thioredoxin family protein [Winogradskyella immobilis]MCC1485361.1 thioredoxin family protein [Winogradskyella immobilis]MCG0017453.1 thioredoxin family protein [Winogradskyella immobilis]